MKKATAITFDYSVEICILAIFTSHRSVRYNGLRRFSDNGSTDEQVHFFGDLLSTMAAASLTALGAPQRPASFVPGGLTMKALRQQSLGLLADPSPLVFEGVCPGETVTAVLRLVNRTPRSVRAFVTLPPPQSPSTGLRLPPAGQGGIGGSTWTPTALAEPSAGEVDSGPFSFFLESKGTLHPGAEQLVWVTFRCPPLSGAVDSSGSLQSVTGSVYEDGAEALAGTGGGVGSVSPAGVAAALAGGRGSAASAAFSAAFATGARHYSGQLVVRYAELAHPTASTASSLGTDRAVMMGMPNGPLTGEAATLGGLGTGFGQTVTLTVPLLATAVPARLLLHPPFLNGGGASVLPRVPPGPDEAGPGLGLGTLAMVSSTASLLTTGSTAQQAASASASASASTLLPPLPGAAVAEGGRTRAALHAAVNVQAPLLEFGPVPLLQPARFAIRLGNPGGCPLKVTLSISGSEPASKPVPGLSSLSAAAADASAEAAAAATTAAREEFGLALPPNKRGAQSLPAGARSPGRSPSRQRLGGPPPPRDGDGRKERPARPEWGSVHSVPSAGQDAGRFGSVSFSGDGYASRSHSPSRSASPVASPLRGSPWHSLEASPAASPTRGSPQHTPALGLSPEGSMELPPQLPMPMPTARSFARVGSGGRPGADGDDDDDDGTGAEGNYPGSGLDEGLGGGHYDREAEVDAGSRSSQQQTHLVLRKRRGSPVTIPRTFATTPAAAADQQGAATLTMTLPPRSQRRVYVQFRPIRVRTTAAMLQIDSVPQLPAWASALEAQASGPSRPRTAASADAWGQAGAATGTGIGIGIGSSSPSSLSVTPSVMQVRIRLAGSALPGGVREAASAVLAAAAASAKKSTSSRSAVANAAGDGPGGVNAGADEDDGGLGSGEPSPERIARFTRTYTGAARSPARWLKTDPGLALIDARLDGYKAKQSRRLAAVLRARAAQAEASRAADESEGDDDDDDEEDDYAYDEEEDEDDDEDEADEAYDAAAQGTGGASGEAADASVEEGEEQMEGQGGTDASGALVSASSSSQRRTRRRRDRDEATTLQVGGTASGSNANAAGYAAGQAGDPVDEVFTDDWYDPRSLAHAGGWSAAEKNAAAYRQILDLGSSGWVAPSSMRGHGAVAFVLGRRKAALRRAARAQAASAAAAASGHVAGSSGAGASNGRDGSQTGPAGVGFLARAGTGRLGHTSASGTGGGTSGDGGASAGPPRGADGASLAAEPFVQRYVATKASAGVLAAPAPQSQGHIVPASEVLAAAAVVAQGHRAGTSAVGVAPPGIPVRSALATTSGSMMTSSVVGTAAVVPLRPHVELNGSAASYLTAGDLLVGLAAPGDVAAWEADALAASSAAASASSASASASPRADASGSTATVSVESVSGGTDGGSVPLAFRLTPASVSTLVLTEQAIARRQAAAAAATASASSVPAYEVAPDAAIAGTDAGAAAAVHAAAQAQAGAFEQQRRAALAAASARLTTAAAAVAPPRPPTVAELASSAGVLLALEMSRSWLYPLLRLRGDATAVAAPPSAALDGSSSGAGAAAAGEANRSRSGSNMRSKSLRLSGGFTATASGRKPKGPLLAGRRLLPSELATLLAVLSGSSGGADNASASSGLTSSAPPQTGTCIDFLLGAAWDEFVRGGAPAPPLSSSVSLATPPSPKGAASAAAHDGAVIVSIIESNLTKLVRLLAAPADAPLPHRKLRKGASAGRDAALMGGGEMTTAGRSVHVTPSSSAALAGHASRIALASYDVTVRLAPALAAHTAASGAGASPSSRLDNSRHASEAEREAGEAMHETSPARAQQRRASLSGDEASGPGQRLQASTLRTASRGSAAATTVAGKSRAGSATSQAGSRGRPGSSSSSGVPAAANGGPQGRSPSPSRPGSQSPSPTRRLAASRAEALGIGRGVGFSAGDAGAAEVRGVAEAGGLVSSRTAAAQTAADLAGIGGMTALLRGTPLRGRLASPTRSGGAGGRSISEGARASGDGAGSAPRIAVTVLSGAAGAGANALLRGAQVTGPQLPLQIAAAVAKARGVDLVSFGQTSPFGATSFTTGAASGAGSAGLTGTGTPSPLPPAARALASTMRWSTVSHTLAARQAAVARIAAAGEAEASAAASRATAPRRGVPPGAAPSPALLQLLTHVRSLLRSLESAVTARLRSLRLAALPMPDARFGTPLALASAAAAGSASYATSALDFPSGTGMGGGSAGTGGPAEAFDRSSMYGAAGKRRMSLTGEAPAVVALRVAHRNSVAGLEAQLGIDGNSDAAAPAGRSGADAGAAGAHESGRREATHASMQSAAAASAAAAAVRSRAAFVAALHSPRLYPPLSLYAALSGMRLSSLLLAHPTLRHALLPDGAGLGAVDDTEAAADGAGDAAGVNGTDATEASAAAAASAALTAVVSVSPPLPPAAVQPTAAELAAAVASAAPGNRAAAEAAAAAAKAAGSADGAAAASALMAARAQSLLQVRALLAGELVRQRVAARLARLARTAPHWLVPPATAPAAAQDGFEALAGTAALPDAATAHVLARTAAGGAMSDGAAITAASPGVAAMPASQTIFDGIRAPAYLAYLQQEGWAERSWLLTPPQAATPWTANDGNAGVHKSEPSLVDDLLCDLPDSDAMPMLPSRSGAVDVAHGALAAALAGAAPRPSTGSGSSAGVVSSDWDRACPSLARLFLSPSGTGIGRAHVASVMEALPLPVPFPGNAISDGAAGASAGARCGYAFGMQLADTQPADAGDGDRRGSGSTVHDIGATWRCGLQTLATTEEVDMVLPDTTLVRAARCAGAARSVASAALLDSVDNASRRAAAAAAGSTSSLAAARKRASIAGGVGLGGKAGELPGGVSEADAVAALLAAAGTAGAAAPAGSSTASAALKERERERDRDGGSAASTAQGASSWLPGRTALSFSLLNAAIAAPPAVPAVGALPAGWNRSAHGAAHAGAQAGAGGPVASAALALAAAGLLPSVSSGILPPNAHSQAPHTSAAAQPWALLASSPEAALSLCMTPLASFLGDMSLGAATIAAFGLPMPDERPVAGSGAGGDASSDAANVSGCAGTTAGPDSFANVAVGRSTGLLLQTSAVPGPAAIATDPLAAATAASVATGSASALVPAAGAYERPPLDGAALDASSTMWRSVASGASGTGVWGLTPLPLPLTPWLNYLPPGTDQPLRESALSLTALAHSCAGGWGSLPLPQGVVRGVPTLALRMPAALPPPASASTTPGAAGAATSTPAAPLPLPPFAAIAGLAPDPVIASAVAALLPAGAAATAPPGAAGMAREMDRTREAAVALSAALAFAREQSASASGSSSAQPSHAADGVLGGDMGGDDVAAALRAFGISPTALPSLAASAVAAVAASGTAAADNAAASALALFPSAAAMWPLLRLPPSGSLQGLRLLIPAPPPASHPSGTSSLSAAHAGSTGAAGPLHWAFAELGFQHPRWRLAAAPGLLAGGGAGGGTGGIGGPSVLLHPRLLGGPAADNAALAAAYAAAGSGNGPLPAAAAQALLHALPSLSLTGGDAGSSAWLLSGPPLEGAVDYALQPLHDAGGGLRAGQAEAHGGAGYATMPLPLPPWLEPPTSLAALVATVPPVGCAGAVATTHAVGAGGSLSFEAAASLPGLMLARDSSGASASAGSGGGAAGATLGGSRAGVSSAASVAGSAAGGAATSRPAARVSGAASVTSSTTGGAGATGAVGATGGKRSVRFVGSTAASRTISAGAAAAATIRNASRFAAAEPAAKADGEDGLAGGSGAAAGGGIDSDRSSFAAAAAAKTVKPSASGAASAAAQAAAAAAVAASVAVVQGALARRRRLHLAAAAEEATFIAIAAAAAAATAAAAHLGAGGGGTQPAASGLAGTSAAGAGRSSTGTRSAAGHGSSAAGGSHSGSVAASRVFGGGAGGAGAGAGGGGGGAFGASGSFAGGAFLAGGGSYAGGASGYLTSHAERSHASGAGGGASVAATLGLGLAPSRGGLWHPTALASRYGIAPVLDPNGSLVTLRSALAAGGGGSGSFYASLSHAPSLAAVASAIGAATAAGHADAAGGGTLVVPLPLLDATRFTAAAAVAAVAGARSAGAGLPGGFSIGAGAPALPFAALRSASVPLALALVAAASSAGGVPRPLPAGAPAAAALAAAFSAAGAGALSLLSPPVAAAHLHAAFAPPPRGGLAGAASGMHGAALLLGPAPPAIPLPPSASSSSSSSASASASSSTAGIGGELTLGDASQARPPQRLGSPTDVLPFAQRSFAYAPHNSASALLQRMSGPASGGMDLDAATAAGEGAEAEAEARALAEAEDGTATGTPTLSQLLGLAPTPTPASLAATATGGFGFGFGFTAAAALSGHGAASAMAGSTRSLLTVPLPGSLSLPLPLVCSANSTAGFTTGLSIANADRVATASLLPPLLARPLPAPDAQAHFDSESEDEDDDDDDDGPASPQRTSPGKRRTVRNSRGLIDPAAAAAAVVKPVTLSAALAAFVPPELQAGVAPHAAALDAAYDAWRGAHRDVATAGSAASPLVPSARGHEGGAAPPLSLPLPLQGWAGVGGLGTVGLAPPLPLVPSHSRTAASHGFASQAVAGPDGAPLATVAERAELAADAAAVLASHAAAGALPSLLAGSRFARVLPGADGLPPFDTAAHRSAGGAPVAAALQALRQQTDTGSEPAASGLNAGIALADRRFRTTAHEL